MSYLIRRVGYNHPISDNDFDYITKVASILTRTYNAKYNWGNFQLDAYCEQHYMLVLEKEDELGRRKYIGLLAFRLEGSIFDFKTKVLNQDILYSETKRGTYELLKYFIDFGKQHANHLITMIGAETNINPASLEKLGFKELETYYRLEV